MGILGCCFFCNICYINGILFQWYQSKFCLKTLLIIIFLTCVLNYDLYYLFTKHFCKYNVTWSYYIYSITVLLIVYFKQFHMVRLLLEEGGIGLKV